MDKITASPPHYILRKPDPQRVSQKKVFDTVEKDQTKYRKLLEKANEPIYLYWDKFQYKVKDDILNPEELWYWVRQLRNVFSTETSIRAEDGEFFKWLRLPSTEEHLHAIDMLSGGQLLPFPNILSQSNRQTFINRGIIEEAIASSQLEGAHTTRAAAKQMIVEKREPRNESERMIFNNYQTMSALEEEYKTRDLSLDLLFEIHRMLTQGTVKKSEQNRLRGDKDEITVQGRIGQFEYTSHIPPKQSFVEKEIERLIGYANDPIDQRFTHPITKAIFLHFWIGYLHPFTDGNGRLARALFYWYLLRKGYWTFMFLPISTAIKKASTQYALAYINSEQDNLDVTYFHDFHLRKILRSIEEFQSYLENKIKENKEVDEIISKKVVLNERQKQLIHYLISDQSPSTTVTSHATINSISRQTAAKDIKGLELAKLVFPKRDGKYIRYYPSDVLATTAPR